VLRRDQAELQRHLGRWDLRVALGPGSGLKPWPPGHHVDAPLHAVWCRERPTDRWAFELLLNDAGGDRWLFRRNHAIALPLAEIGRTTHDGIPYLRPELVLLYKAKNARRRDEDDLRAVVPTLRMTERAWLADTISLVHPGHPWIERLRSPAPDDQHS
jgi:hypothetical protein